MSLPIISVIIPTFNSQQYLKEAIESVLNQSYQNLQVLILDDASADDTVAIAKSFIDRRIEVYESKINRGQSYQLNKGIAKSTGEYVCIMHSDDLMYTSKLEKQFTFFQNNPAVGVCGCNVQLIGEKAAIWVFPEKNQDCKDLLLTSIPFAHPAVVFRKSVFNSMDTVYNPGMAAAEDYDLWVRLADKVDFGNVQEVLLDYRIHSMQLSEVKKEEEINLVDAVRKKIITNLFKVKNEEEASCCFKVLYYPGEMSVADGIRGIELLWHANKKNGMFGNSLLKGRLKHTVFRILSVLPLNQRLKYLLTNAVLFEISFFKSMVSILLFRKDDQDISK